MKFRRLPKGRPLFRWGEVWQDSLGIVKESDVTFVIKWFLEIFVCIIVIPIVYLMSALMFPIRVLQGYYTGYRYCFYKLTDKEEKYTQEYLSKHSKNT